MMKAIYLVLIAVLTGCVSQYKFAGGEKSADLTIAGNSKNFFVDAYKDASCAVSEYGERLATFYGPTANVQDKETGITVPVPTGKEFVYTFRYIDAQFALNRMCSITVGFIPQAGKKYRSYLTVDPSVTKCDVTLEDITFANPLEVSTFYVNENLCLGGKDMGPISGKPERLRWRVHVILIPQ